jgi:hypothetical protein
LIRAESVREDIKPVPLDCGEGKVRSALYKFDARNADLIRASCKVAALEGNWLRIFHGHAIP